MAAALLAMRARGARFLVAGRKEAGSGTRFLTLADLPPPPERVGRDFFVGISECEFRVDVSSTELRASLATAKA